MMVFGLPAISCFGTSGEGLLFFCVLGVTAAALVFASSRGVVMWGGGSALVAAVAFVWGRSLAAKVSLPRP